MQYSASETAPLIKFTDHKLLEYEVSINVTKCNIIIRYIVCIIEKI